MNTRSTWLAGLLAVAALLPAAALSDEAALVRGVSLIDAGRFDEARQELQQSVDADSNPADRGRAYFYLGLCEQQRARSLPAGPQRQTALQAARDYYQQALGANPKSGGALNNLAQVQADLGDLEAANATLERALALGDGRQALYQSTRARLLSAGPLDARALQALLDAALASPDDDAARARLVQAAAPANPALIVELATALLSNGYAGAAEDVCAQGLAAAPALGKQLLVLLARTLAAQSYEPTSFDKTKASTAQVLARLRGDATVGSGANQLLALHLSPKPEAAAYSWWMQGYNRYSPPARDAPHLALRVLAIRLGDWYRRVGTGEALLQAEPYALLAVELSGNTADPTAILGLAEIYANTDRKDKLREVSDRYAGSLFEGKAAAYMEKNDELIYQFHLALGTIYGYLEQWESPGWSPASAIFQLEHARETAERINRSTPDCGANCRTVPPMAIQLLATAYEKTGKPEQAVRVRAEAAETYVKVRRPDMVKQLAVPVQPAPPPAGVDKAKLIQGPVKNKAIQYQPKPQ